MKFPFALTSDEVWRVRNMDPPWRHHFHFTNVSTGGLWDERHMTFIDERLPDFGGKNVFDIGFGDGYYSFRAEALGAKSVLGLDVYHRPTAELVSKVLDSNALLWERDIYEWEVAEVFDVVLCLGVFYHLPDIPLLFKICASALRKGGVAVFEGPAMGGRLNRFLRLPRWATVARYPTDTNNHHFWRMTGTALVTLLEYAGFEVQNIDYMWGRALVTAGVVK